MAYLKRQKVPKNWPVKRKGTTYLVRPMSNVKNGVPLLILLRDVLGIVQTKKEAKRIIQQNQLLINGRKVRNEREGIVLFDVITMIPSKTNYRMVLLENKKFGLEEIKENEADKKIAKVAGKKVLKGKKLQLNLSDGRNFFSDVKCGINDSVIVDFKSKKIEKCVPLKEKAKVLILSGKHAGFKGVIEKINDTEKTVELKTKEKKINALIKQIIVIE